MVTWDKGTTVKRSGTKLKLLEGHCLAADTKPTDGVANGSTLIEMDTGKVYMFDEAGEEWLEYGGE